MNEETIKLFEKYDYKISNKNIKGVLQVDNLNDTITHLSFGISFNKPVDTQEILSTDNISGLKQSLSHSIATDCAHHKFTESKFIGCNLPSSITHLSFGYYFNQPVDTQEILSTDNISGLKQSLSHSIATDCAHHKFTESKFIGCNLPSSITHLSFGKNFNQPIDNLNDAISHLSFGKKFNHQIENLPDTITYLYLSECFNQPINKLPKELLNLILGSEFNQKIDALPNKIETIKFINNNNYNKKYEIIKKNKKNNYIIMKPKNNQETLK
jgi:hypothetical protein